MTTEARAALDALAASGLRLVVHVDGPSRLTVDQVAEVAGVGKRTVWDWVAAGRLPAPEGRRWAREAVERALAAGPVRRYPTRQRRTA